MTDSPTSTSTSTSTSTGTPVVIQTPQSEYDLQFARQAQRAGNDQYNWAGNQYQYLQNLANETIPQFLQTAATSNDLANKQLSQYEGMYMPAAERFNEMANSYASAARQKYAMGQAEADATQNTNAAWQNTKQELQSHGIDPSSGMYAGLKAASETAGGAAAAGAANQARQGVENTGIGLQEQNLNFGSTEPAAALNSLNVGLGANSAAVNTGQSTVNTGVNAYNSADNFYNTAMKVQLPTSGQQTSSQSQSQSHSGPTTNPMDHSGNIGTGLGFAVARGGLIEPDDNYRRGGKVRRGGGRHGGGHMKQNDGSAQGVPSQSRPPLNSFLASNQDLQDEAARNNAADPSNMNPANAPLTPTPPTLPIPPTGGAAQGVPMDPNMAGGGDSSLAQGGIPQPHGHQGRPHPPHPYQVNGLPDASTGGHVPYELSPSHGHTTDDVVANLNAGEFVLPRRTVHHMGHKALYDIIAKSDKEMGLHPQPVGPQSLKKGSGADQARSAVGGI